MKNTLRINRNLKRSIPTFSSTTDEAEYWDTHDLTDFGPMEASQIRFTSRLNRSLNVRFNNEDVQRLRLSSERLGIHASTLVRMIVRRHLQTAKPVQAASG